MSFVALACMLIAVDGDTLRCGEERIRLLGIDAPELPGHCAEGRHCAPGDPFASRAALAAAIKGTATIERQGRDHYDRTLARIRVNGVDLSCSQLVTGHATYRPDWDQFALVATACGLFRLDGQTPAASGGRRTPSQPTGRSGTNWSYRSCAEARRAGAAPLRRGTPEYGRQMDGDGDGIACEPAKW